MVAGSIPAASTTKYPESLMISDRQKGATQSRLKTARPRAALFQDRQTPQRFQNASIQSQAPIEMDSGLPISVNRCIPDSAEAWRAIEDRLADLFSGDRAASPFDAASEPQVS